MRFILLAAMVLAPVLSIAQTGDYFPLQAGNTWIYRAVPGSRLISESNEFRTISVDGTESIQGVDYFRVDFFGRVLRLRASEDGSIVSLNPQSGAEEPWLSLNLATGESFPTTLDNCTKSGTIQSREATGSTPIGSFDNAVKVEFQASCADAGTTEEVFGAGIGLLRHEETSIAGPRPYELVYYRAGAASQTGPEVSFTVALDAAQYKAGGRVAARLTLRSTLPAPVSLNFPSGQSYDLKIFNEQGDMVYQWSAERAFTQIVREEVFGPGERSYALAATLPNLAPGHYSVQGYLATNPRLYLGQTAFDILP